ncbi:MAG: class I SAM-dependent DNA methyltransferase, partial [Peptococcaceae bacterium]|nr:class I SAM-dependent DNA methyltransferase [Peptococcaceae bacterium]
MNELEQRQAAKQFAQDWKDRGDEKQDTQSFWLALLQNVFGVEDATKYIQFEMPVKLDHTSFIDAYIPETKVLIEQKSAGIGLNKGYQQSDGSLLTPYQQARRYAGYLPHEQNPRWIVVCNFTEFHIHDMNHPNNTPDIIRLDELEKECYRLNFLVNTSDQLLKREEEVSVKAGELVGKLYDALSKQYKNPDDEQSQKSLNELCVRLVFCLYAEDAGLFGGHTMFHDYLRRFAIQDVRRALIDLFQVLDTEEHNRDPYLTDELAAFPYVNGGLFANKHIEIPHFTEEIMTILLEKASEDFDWSYISPTIFGAVFESTLNPETRRSGGMHYTSVANIHKVIDPLFLDDLKAELEEIRDIKVPKKQDERLEAFQHKLAALSFLDPACGSGNFLTEAYISLRRLENEALKIRYGDKMTLGFDNPIQVSIGQFYGIEINDFAVTVAKTALWIAESQMHKETMDILPVKIPFLPLKSYANIVEGNALRMNWNDVVPKEKLNYIMGNPPFVGARLMGQEQKDDVNLIFKGWKNAGNLDYVACWYKKAADMMVDADIRSALVSTNSVCQGETVANLWKPLFATGVHIDFAHRTFIWDSEAKVKAHVHCVIVGFSIAPFYAPKVIYTSERPQIVNNINAYLLDGENIFVENCSKPIYKNAPQARSGNKPIDDGNYLFEENEMLDFIKVEPQAQKFFRPWIGAYEFINRKNRYCLWLGDCSPSELRKMPHCMERVQAVRDFRLASKSAGTVKLAEKPTRFHVETILENPFLVMPLTSSERRRYVPIGFIPSNYLASNLV